jgi:hypothetical protein
MLPVGMTIPTTIPQRSEIPEGLMNYPVYKAKGLTAEEIHIQYVDKIQS